jgi:hypothetical protein
MSELYRFGRSLREFLQGLLALEGVRAAVDTGGTQPPTGDGTRPVGAMDSFPPAGIDRVKHDLRIALLEVDERGGERELEVLAFEGHMALERGEPYTNEQGLRQVDFTVTSWVATAFSKALGGEIMYILSDTEKQPTSSIRALEKGSDFPAEFDFNLIFDARLNNQVVHRGHHGRPHGWPFFVIPPNHIRSLSPTITSFEDTVIRVAHPERGTTLIFRPRDCNDGASETVVTFRETAGAA